jgi:RNA polymerase sigma factor (TIGR02999 family)
VTQPDVTQLLQDWRQGDERAFDKLVPLVYDELKGMAARYMRSERADHTLQATALVHEAYARMVKANVEPTDRVHFFAVAAQMMRRVLVDHARAHRSAKRGGGSANKVEFDDAIHDAQHDPSSILELDDALSRLAELDERKAKVMELHYFGGLTFDEVAANLDVSVPTVHRDARFAKAWLQKAMQDSE